MFRLGVIEESLESLDTLNILKPFFYSQRIENVLEDTSPIWHTNEYHVPDDKIFDLLPILEQRVKPTWNFNTKWVFRKIQIDCSKSYRISDELEEILDNDFWEILPEPILY